MSRDSARRIRDGLRTLKVGMAYINFDINFKTSEPTLSHHLSFMSTTSATAIPLVGVEDIEVLRCSEELWRLDPCNPTQPASSHPAIDEFDLLEFHVKDKYKHQPAGSGLSQQRMAFAWHVQEILVKHGQHFAHLSGSLGTPESVHQLPITKTDQIPMRSMPIKQSSVNGNIEVMENLLQQGGLGDSAEPNFAANGDVDMSEFVLLIHGDLLTKECLDSVRDSWRIEDTPKNRFQYVVFLLGLFHYKMACADALWRTYLQKAEGRSDPNSAYQHIGILRPQETQIMVTKPGFRRMHDAIHHELRAVILECWRSEVSKRDPVKFTSLKAFMESKPDWDLTMLRISAPQ
jgi:hypothetical protein